MFKATINETNLSAAQMNAPPETPEWRIFLLKDLASVEEAQMHGAKIVEVDMKL